MTRENIFNGFVIVSVSIMMLTSCAKMPIIDSKSHDLAMNADENFSHYDSKSKLRYLISNDSTHLYVSFDTDDPGIQKNIMMKGARISVDTNGKKKGTAYLK